MTDMVDFNDYLKACINFYNASSDWLCLPSNFSTTNEEIDWTEARLAPEGTAMRAQQDAGLKKWKEYIADLEALIKQPA